MPSAKIGIAPSNDDGHVYVPVKKKGSFRNPSIGRKSAAVGIGDGLPDHKQRKFTKSNKHRQHHAPHPAQQYPVSKTAGPETDEKQEHAFEIDAIVDFFHVNAEHPRGVWASAIVEKKTGEDEYQLLLSSGARQIVAADFMRASADDHGTDSDDSDNGGGTAPSDSGNNETKQAAAPDTDSNATFAHGIMKRTATAAERAAAAANAAHPFHEDDIVEYFRVIEKEDRGEWVAALVLEEMSGNRYRLVRDTGEHVVVPADLIRPSDDDGGDDDTTIASSDATGDKIRMGPDGQIFRSQEEYVKAKGGRDDGQYHKLATVSENDALAVETLHKVHHRVRRDSASTINNFARHVLTRTKSTAEKNAADANSKHSFKENDIIEYFHVDADSSRGEWVSAMVDKPLAHNRYRVIRADGDYVTVPADLMRPNELDDDEASVSSTVTGESSRIIRLDGDGNTYRTEAEFLSANSNEARKWEELPRISESDLAALETLRMHKEKVRRDSSTIIANFARNKVLSPRSQSKQRKGLSTRANPPRDGKDWESYTYQEDELVQLFDERANSGDASRPGAWVNVLVDKQLPLNRYVVIKDDGTHLTAHKMLLRPDPEANADDDSDTTSVDDHGNNEADVCRLASDGRAYSQSEYIAAFSKERSSDDPLDTFGKALGAGAANAAAEWKLLPLLSQKDAAAVRALTVGRNAEADRSASKIQNAFRNQKLQRKLAVRRFAEGEVVLLRRRNEIDKMAVDNDESADAIVYDSNDYSTARYWTPAVILQVHPNSSDPGGYATYDVAHVPLVAPGQDLPPAKVELGVHRAMLAADVPDAPQNRVGSGRDSGATCVALWDKSRNDPGDLEFREGDVIPVTRHPHIRGWFLGFDRKSRLYGDVLASHVRILPDAYFNVGTPVISRYMNTEHAFEGVVVASHLDHTYDIQYSDGDFEAGISWEMVAALVAEPSSDSEDDSPVPPKRTVHHPFYDKYVPAARAKLAKRDGGAVAAAAVAKRAAEEGSSPQPQAPVVVLHFAAGQSVEFWEVDRESGRLVWIDGVVRGHEVHSEDGEHVYLVEVTQAAGHNSPKTSTRRVPVDHVNGLFQLGQRVDIVADNGSGSAFRQVSTRATTSARSANSGILSNRAQWEWAIVVRKGGNGSSDASGEHVLRRHECWSYDVIIGDSRKLRRGVRATDMVPFDKDFDHGEPVFFYAGDHHVPNAYLNPQDLRAGFVVAAALLENVERSAEDASCNVVPVTTWRPDSGSGMGAGDREALKQIKSGPAVGIGEPLGDVVLHVPEQNVFPRFCAGDAVIWFDIEKACAVEATFIAFQPGLSIQGTRGLDIHICSIVIAPTARNLHYTSGSSSNQRTVRVDHLTRVKEDLDAGEPVEVLVKVPDHHRDPQRHFSRGPQFAWRTAVVTGINLADNVLTVEPEVPVSKKAHTKPSVRESPVDIHRGYAHHRFKVGDNVEYFDFTHRIWNAGVIVKVPQFPQQGGGVYKVSKCDAVGSKPPSTNSKPSKKQEGADARKTKAKKKTFLCPRSRLRRPASEHRRQPTKKRLPRRSASVKSQQRGQQGNGISAKRRRFKRSVTEAPRTEMKSSTLPVRRQKPEVEVQGHNDTSDKDSVLDNAEASIADEELQPPVERDRQQSAVVSLLGQQSDADQGFSDGTVLFMKSHAASASRAPQLVIVAMDNMDARGPSSVRTVVLRNGDVRKDVPRSLLVEPSEVNVDEADAVARVTRIQIEKFINRGLPTHPQWQSSQKSVDVSQSSGITSTFKTGEHVEALYRKNLTGYWYEGKVLRIHASGKLDVIYADQHIDSFLDPDIHVRSCKTKSSSQTNDSSVEAAANVPLPARSVDLRGFVKIPTFGRVETTAPRAIPEKGDGFAPLGVNPVKLMLVAAKMAFEVGRPAKSIVCYQFADLLLEARVAEMAKTTVHLARLRSFVWESHATVCEARRQGDDEVTALRLLNQAHDLIESVLGARHHRTGAIKYRIARALVRRDQLSEAVRKLKEAKAILKQAYGGHSILYAEVLVDLSAVLRQQLERELSTRRGRRRSGEKRNDRIDEFAPILATQGKALAILRDSVLGIRPVIQVDDFVQYKPPPHHSVTTTQRRLSVGMVQTAAVLLAKIRQHPSHSLLAAPLVTSSGRSPTNKDAQRKQETSGGSIGRIVGSFSLDNEMRSGASPQHQRHDVVSELRLELNEAEELLQEALKLRQTLHGGSRKGSHPAIAEVHILQSYAAFLRAQYAAASEKCSQALKAQRNSLGLGHPLTLHTIQWAIHIARREPHDDPHRLVALYEVGRVFPATIRCRCTQC